MSHQTFKVSILIEDNVENFYIKHYIDSINPVFNRFKSQVFTRNPQANSSSLKIYWIDAENDQILVACEEDFRLFLEEGKGRKIFFSVSNNNASRNDEDESIPMESEPTQQEQRRSKKGNKEEEKRCRRFEKLSKKLKHYEDSFKNEEERSRCRHAEKREMKNNERLERAKRRVDQIRTIIGSIDPANLNSSNNAEPMPSTASSAPSMQSPISPETVQLLSNAISGCLQPCNVINKVLNEVFAIIPHVVGHTTGIVNNNVDQQQQTCEVPKNTTATNTSDANTPVPRQINSEIEELFKEAAKELEKMNEIVNTSNKMEASTSSSSMTDATQVTQIEKIFPNIIDSAISDITIVENLNESLKDQLDCSFVMASENFESSTPPKSRSRESSIEIHDVNSIMSDDSRDWTILSQDELSIDFGGQRNVDPKTGAIPKVATTNSETSQCDAEIQTNDSIKSSFSIETQTPAALSGFANQEQLQASVQKSIDIVQKSIQSIQKSIETNNAAKSEEVKAPSTETSLGAARDIYPSLENAPVIPEQSQANINASKLPQNKTKFEAAVVVYDPNPKINAAVHTMMNMGFSNEDNWLTQLLINVDGDVPKALNFLTPQPKNRKP